MKKIAVLLCLISISLSAQNFEGVLTYKMKVLPHLSDEVKVELKNSSGKKEDSIKLSMNNSNFVERFKKSKNWVDSLRIILGKNKIKKTYYKERVLEYVFDLDQNKKFTHTPEYQCIDSININFENQQNVLKWVYSDSIYEINGVKTRKLTISKKNSLFVDLYISESPYKNTSDGFIYDMMSNLLFDNLYPVRKELEGVWIQRLRYYTKFDQVDIIYHLESYQALQETEEEFRFPNYEYCYWDILDDKKLLKKHRKKMKERAKNRKN